MEPPYGAMYFGYGELFDGIIVTKKIYADVYRGRMSIETGFVNR
jgi:hypothetical protein